MRRWEVSLEVQERLEKQTTVTKLPSQVHPYVAVARQVGAGGSEIAKLVAKSLDAELLDQDLLHLMAERYNLSEGQLNFVDEESASWLREIFAQWMNRRAVPQSAYVRHLNEIVLMSARSGRAVFVGRGAYLLLPRERGLRVWVVAPMEKRLERIMKVHDIGPTKAEKYAEEKDRGRRDLVRRYFHCDEKDPLLYDLVLNTEFLSHEDGAALSHRGTRGRAAREALPRLPPHRGPEPRTRRRPAVRRDEAHRPQDRGRLLPLRDRERVRPGGRRREAGRTRPEGRTRTVGPWTPAPTSVRIP